MPRKPSLSALARKAQEVAEGVTALAAAGDDAADSVEDPFGPHPATEQLLTRRGVTREQLNYQVPADLELKRRMNAYNVANADPGQGNVIAGLLDAFLRAQGFPPDPERVPDDQ
jgi:hypothetical protein